MPQLYEMGIIRHMAKEMVREVGNKSREFYEFVLPPVDMYFDDDSLTVIVDLPGFDKKDIKLTLHKNILSINAERSDLQKDDVVCKQRPNIIDKKILLPIRIEEGKEDVSSAKFTQGVLTIKIPVSHKGKQISIE
jgi:HSP20 family molecular chaperone IbpA